MGNVGIILVSGVAAILIWYFSALPKYYLQARQTGYPIIVSLVSSANPLWLIFGRKVVKSMERKMPPWLFNRFKIALYGWEFTYRYSMQELLGDVFVHVTPAGNEMIIADPDLAMKVLVRRKDFVQLEITTSMLRLDHDGDVPMSLS
jgi:hypothetical protein